MNFTSRWQYPELGDRIYRALCCTVAGRPDLVNWPAFSLADWRLLVDSARVEGVAPLLYHTLYRIGWPDEMPARQRHQLETLYYTTAAHNLMVYGELARFLDACAEADHWPKTMQARPVDGRPATVVLKGAALATKVYPNIALRPLRDLDLLLPRDYLEPAVEVLRSLGYQEAMPEMTPGLKWPAGYHVHLQGGPYDSVAVELHRTLIADETDWRSPRLDWFWDQTEDWTMEMDSRQAGRGSVPTEGAGLPRAVFYTQPSPAVASVSALQLTPTAHLLYLSAHLMLQHGAAQARLVWFYDLHLLVTRCANWLNWNELVERAQAFRWTAAVDAALRAAQDRFTTPLPDGLLDALGDSSDAKTRREVQRNADPYHAHIGGVWSELRWKRWPARLRLAWSIACPSRAYLRWRYKPQPAWLWPLYYFYRWFDILRGSLSLLRRLMHERNPSVR